MRRWSWRPSCGKRTLNGTRSELSGMTKPAYAEAYRAGVPFCMVPREYGGAGLRLLDIVIAAEELCAVDPGFACTVLVNGMGLMPVVWYGAL